MAVLSSDRRPPAVRRVASTFETAYAMAPALIWSAPGRVNLIGEHTDYNNGFVLPFALDQRTAVAVAPTVHSRPTHSRPTHPPAASAPRPAAEWTVYSEAMDTAVTFDETDLVPGALTGWAAYVAGVVWVLREAGIAVPGARIAVCSDVPPGAGLSSSAALECATLAALSELAGTDLPRDRWPALAQRAENAYVGMPCGILDQAAATLCREGHALFLDCRDLATEHVRFELAAVGLSMLIVDTRAPHRHTVGEYAARRATCEAAAAALGLASLRDVPDLDAALAALSDDVMRRRTRHVITENERVHRTVDLLRAGRSADIGPLLTESHRSLADDFEVTVPELDLAVEAALRAGALGARMTGGGFGGCVIALVAAEQAGEVARSVAKAFAAAGFGEPAAFVATAAAGVARAR